MRSTTLSELTRGRDNNFNLIRILAAFAVLFSHSFALAAGSPASKLDRQIDSLFRPLLAFTRN